MDVENRSDVGICLIMEGLCVWFKCVERLTRQYKPFSLEWQRDDKKEKPLIKQNQSFTVSVLHVLRHTMHSRPYHVQEVHDERNAICVCSTLRCESVVSG